MLPISIFALSHADFQNDLRNAFRKSVCRRTEELFRSCQQGIKSYVASTNRLPMFAADNSGQRKFWQATRTFIKTEIRCQSELPKRYKASGQYKQIAI